MMINKININPYIKFNTLQNKRQPVFCGLNQDVFEKRAQETPIVNSRINEKAAQKVPFGVHSVIRTWDLDYIKNRTEGLSKRYKLAASRTAQMAKISKKMFDEQYGKDNYVVVSIGTSPAGIAKGLELMGQDVRYVPISNMEHMCDYCLDDYDKIPAVFDKSKKYKNFLDSIGLNKEEILKDKRHYVVIDYTNEGTCLNTVKDVAKNVLNIKSDNVDYVSINKALINYANKNDSNTTKDDVETYIRCYMQMPFMATFAGIPHLNCMNLENIDNLLLENKSIEDFNFEAALWHYLNGGKYED